MATLRPYLFLPLAVLSGIGLVAGHTLDVWDLLGMNLPQWVWQGFFAALFIVTVLGIVIIQGRELDSLKKEHAHIQPAAPVGEQSIKSVLLVDRLETFMSTGGDLVEGLQRIQGSQIPHALSEAVIDWGRSGYFALKAKYPGYAAFFLSDLPSQDNRYEHELLLGYMNRRLGDLRAVIERERQTTMR